MKLNASPETVQNVGEVFKLAGFLDDTVGHPDKAKIAAWAEQIERHRLTRSDLLDGLQLFYDLPRDKAIGIGDLIHHAKIVKRDRLDREDDALREVRRHAVDVKAADEVRVMAARVPFGPAKNPTERLERAVEALQTCYGEAECRPAIAEFCAAKAEVAGERPKRLANRRATSQAEVAGERPKRLANRRATSQGATA